MKIVLTGGHLSPALAIIEELPKETELLFIGRKKALEGDSALSLEYKKISALGIPFVNLITGRFQRRFTRYTISSLLKLPLGFFQSLWLLKRHNPDIVLCFGGYLQIPVAAAAFLLQIPVVIHEQTPGAGMANKICARFARKICISWKESAGYFPKEKTEFTGILLRREFFSALKSQDILPKKIHTDNELPLNLLYKKKNKKVIFITGGSLGAHPINSLVKGCITELLKKYYVIHQTGDAREYEDFEELAKARDSLPVNLKNKYFVSKFIEPDEFPKIMELADLIICRAGINTVTELVYLQKPCLLIPLPHGQTNEQMNNALLAREYGIGKVLIQEKLTPEILYSQVDEFVAKLELDKNSSVKKNFINYDSAKKIITIITQAVEKRYRQKKQK
jgi:UDP-N-acetylglucosamine--N-acetylmuramyl-(pentapeptide) pyrophosphoryl-undecaprenol N-acetylglucosamine transferase